MALTLDGTNGIVSSGSITTQSATGVIFSDSSSLPAASSPFGLKNRIINGDMRIDQRNAGASLTNNTGVQFPVDRMLVYGNGVASKFTMQQNQGSVTPPVGFTNYLGFTSSAATTVGSADIYEFLQSIEGYNVADLDYGKATAKTVTLSFWARSSLTGTFGGALQNSGSTRSYVFSYTISAANTWEYKTVTIPGDTGGTWLTNNGIGLQVIWGLGVGSTYSSTAGSWASAAQYSVTGATSVVSTNGATFYITGVQLEIGSTATPFERRLYGQELMLCQRYYQCIGGAFNGSVANQYYAPGYMSGTTQFIGTIQLPVTMRTSPSFGAINPSNFVVFSGGVSLSCSAVNLDVASPTTVGIYTTNSAGTAYQGSRILQSSTNASQMQFSAEL